MQSIAQSGNTVNRVRIANMSSYLRGHLLIFFKSIKKRALNQDSSSYFFYNLTFFSNLLHEYNIISTRTKMKSGTISRLESRFTTHK